MITHTDVAQLNQSMNNLGDSFMQTRLESDRMKQLGVENNQRQQGIDIARDRNRIADERTQAVEGDRAKQAARIVWKGAFDTQMKLMEQGHLSPEHFNESLKAIAAKLPESMRAQLADDPLYIAGVTGELELNPPDAQQPEYREVKDGNGNVVWKGAWMPGTKSLHPANVTEPQPKPWDFTEIRKEQEIPGEPATPDQPEVTHKEGGFLGIGRKTVVDKPAVPGKPAGPPTKQTTIERVPKMIGNRTNAPAPAPASPVADQSFGSEADARAAGRQSGDVVRIQGVGKVRLK